MSSGAKGGDLFIVDNSVSGWTGLRYLEEWTGIARSLDIATGYFEIGALLALDGKWQQLERIRILMGTETTHRTRRALLEAVTRQVTERLDASIEADKDRNPFLAGVTGILEALQAGRIECRVYDKEKFHAKAYITHAKLAVVGSRALVGSSNFTKPGLTENIELNIQVQTGAEVAQLQQWFETHWQEASPVTEAVIEVVSRQVRAFTPFEVYAKGLHDLFVDSNYTGEEWEVLGPDRNGSRVFPRLDRYQQEGYRSLMRIANQYRGAFLCDGVGLGKTFVGLMLLERLVVKDRRRVALIVPKSGREPVWEATIRRYCPELLSGFLPLRIINHTDLTRGKTGDVDWPAVMDGIRDQADVVVIDEAHNFRNPGLAGKGEKTPSRYRKLAQMLDGPSGPKQLFLLTATPINNSLHDFRHMVELFTHGDEGFFGQTLGIGNLRAHFIALEKQVLEAVLESSAAQENDREAGVEAAGKALADDRLFRALVVQRSRAYVRNSQKQEGRSQAIFPDRAPPKVAAYSVKKTYGNLLDLVDRAFNKRTPLFVLPIYNPLAYIRKPPSDDPLFAFSKGRQMQVVGLIRTQFLKRFESSAHAFGKSCERLMLKILAWAEVHAQKPAEKRRLDRWKQAHPELTGFFEQMRISFDEEEAEAEDDLIPQEMLEAVEELDRNEYDVEAMIDDCIDDLNQIAEFTRDLAKLDVRHDDKLKSLIKLLTDDPVLKTGKCLIFTEFADTARYLKKSLQEAGIEGIEQIDGSSKLDRGLVIKRFAPYYNDSSSARLEESGQTEIRILIATDVLSEGLNLQDATRLINYDIHWNPVRLMQRIGRVDRRMNPEVESALLADHPDQKKIRGHVQYWNFLPPEDLNRLLTLYTRVTHKVLRISETFGIEGKVLLRPDDHLKALKEFNEEYEGTPSKLESMRLEYRGLLADDPTLEARLNGLPGRVFSGKPHPKGGRALFCCYLLPALAAPEVEGDEPEWSITAGPVQWYLVDLGTHAVTEGAESVHELVRCEPKTPRYCVVEEAKLLEARRAIEKHIKNSYLKQVQAPAGIKPSLSAWMELN